MQLFRILKQKTLNWFNNWEIVWKRLLTSFLVCALNKSSFEVWWKIAVSKTWTFLWQEQNIFSWMGTKLLRLLGHILKSFTHLYPPFLCQVIDLYVSLNFFGRGGHVKKNYFLRTSKKLEDWCTKLRKFKRFLISTSFKKKMYKAENKNNFILRHTYDHINVKVFKLFLTYFFIFNVFLKIIGVLLLN